MFVDFYHAELLPLVPVYAPQALLNPELPVPKDDPDRLAEEEPPQDLVLLPLLLFPKAFMMLPLLQLLLLLLPQTYVFQALSNPEEDMMLTDVGGFVCVDVGVDETCVL